MRRLPCWLKIVATTGAGLVLFMYLTVMFVHSAELLRLANRVMAPHGLKLSATSFTKAFPLGISAKGVSLASQSGEVLTFDRFTLRLRLLPLFGARLVFSGTGTIGKGTIELETELTRKGRTDFSCRNVRLEDIPFFRTVAGAQAKGELRIKGDLQGKGQNTRGSLQLEASNLDLKGVSISGTPLPDASYRTLQGMLRIGGGKTVLESVTLQGEGLYVRLSGSMPASGSLADTPIDLKLELMPKPAFLESQKFVFLLLAKYTVTPGHYQLPIRGTLGSPMLQ